MKARAVRVHQDPGINSGSINARLETIELPLPAVGEVLIRVQYSSINYKDALAITGAGRILRTYPLVAGIDLAGVVQESNDARYQMGQSVLVTGCGLSETRNGGYAEFAVVPGDAVIAVPTDWTALDVMTIGTAGFTAALAVHRMEQNDQSPAQGEIVVTGATGGVGSVAIDVLAARGYSVTAISSKTDHDDYLRQLGASKVLHAKELTLGKAPLESAQFAGAIDNLGGEWLSWLIRSTRPRGNIASIGMAAGGELHTSVMPFLLRGVAVLGINSAGTDRALRETVWQRLQSDLRPRHLTDIRTRVITLDDVIRVMPDYLKGTLHGRTVVHIQD